MLKNLQTVSWTKQAIAVMELIHHKYLFKIRIKKAQNNQSRNFLDRNFQDELYAGIPEGAAQNSSGSGTALEERKTLT